MILPDIAYFHIALSRTWIEQILLGKPVNNNMEVLCLAPFIWIP